MTCPHSTRPSAGPCSQCTPNVVVRRVTHADGMLLVDGVPERPFDSDNEKAKYYARRGGRR